MAKWGSCDFSQLVELQQRMGNFNTFYRACASELAARLLAALQRRTPVDTGALRRGWTVSSGFDVRVTGGQYVIELVNPVEYAAYVNYGHRTPNHQGWVPGQLFMEGAIEEVDSISRPLLERRMEELLRRCFHA